jgi:hypothetical protein
VLGEASATALAVVVAALVPATALAETAWVASLNNPRAVALDTVSGRQGSPVGGLAGTRAIAVTPDGRTVYLARWDRVTPLDAATETAGPDIAVGEGASDLAVSPDGRTLLVTSTIAGTVTPISTATNAAGSPVAVGQPTGIAIAPDGTTAYVLTAGATLTPIDLTMNAARTPIALGYPGDAIGITPDGTLVLVGETDWQPTTQRSFVQVVQLPSGQVEAPVAIEDSVVDSLVVAPGGSTAYIGEAAVWDLIGTRRWTPGGLAAFDIASRTARRLPVWVTAPAWGSVSDLAVSGDGRHLFGTVPCNDQHCITGGAFELDTATDAVRELRLDAPDPPDVTNPSPSSIALAPDPNATFTSTAGPTGRPSSFDAGASSNAGGTVSSYAWQFGDDTPTAITTSPTVTHTYARRGTYTVTLTTTNEGGCADRYVYTGQTATCTGARTATTNRTITITPRRPTAHTGSARAVRPTRATLHGTIRAAGHRVSWHFDYGTSKHYRRATPHRALRARRRRIAVRSTLTGLAPNTRYHYRLVVEIRAGSTGTPVLSAGHDEKFKTRPRRTEHARTGASRP